MGRTLTNDATLDTSDDMRAHWKHLYAERLPSLAKARDPVQRVWPVYLDHCFARIVLDNAVGGDKPWTAVVKAPAIKHMSSEQMFGAIKLGEQIAAGKADLVALNERSLALRGKKRKSGAVEDATYAPPKKGKVESATISSYFSPPLKSEDEAEAAVLESKQGPTSTDMSVETDKISKSDLTAFRKQILTLLCQVPRGRYSTYQAMSDYVTKTSHKTCARAIGSAMRNNPFAPEVPCHRILAADGSLGGFGGSWGADGLHASKKRQLLHDEGVFFDSRGRVKGPPFTGFTDGTRSLEAAGLDMKVPSLAAQH